MGIEGLGEVAGGGEAGCKEHKVTVGVVCFLRVCMCVCVCVPRDIDTMFEVLRMHKPVPVFVLPSLSSALRLC